MAATKQNERSIRIRAARTNNLRDVDLEVPRGSLVVFVGVSGSGKSSLVFETIAAEAGYQLNETYPPYIRTRLPKWNRPEVDLIDGLSTVIVIDQRRLGGNARSTVGTITDAYTYLRLLFSRASKPHVGASNHFSFNDPAGMCTTCAGLGEQLAGDPDKLVDLNKSLQRGAILMPGFNGKYLLGTCADAGFDMSTPVGKWTAAQRKVLFYGAPASRSGSKSKESWEGLVPRFGRVYLNTDKQSDRRQATVEQFASSQPCPDCHGDRLNEAARSARVAGTTIVEMSRMEVGDLADVLRKVKTPSVAPVVAALRDRLEALTEIGLGYLSLSRSTASLSGGESQRIKTVRHLNSSLTEMLYVFDEPTVGLHPHDVQSMTDLLKRLRDNGNSVLVVEHDPDVMRHADQIVEIGPAAGSHGGRLVFQGAFADLAAADTPTGRALRQRRNATAERREPTGRLRISKAKRNNLQNVTVDIPTGVLTAITGVAGSGKSSLIAELVEQHPATIVDQRPVSTNRRSSPITYTGIAPAIRKLFADHNDISTALFSANSDGACPECKGLGFISTDLAFLEDQEVICSGCDGRRFTEEVLAYTVDGLTIADVHDLTIDEAVERLGEPRIARSLRAISDVGLGYLRLGQSLTTLSGGECQRLKIARELTDRDEHAIYVLDEPTTGLHLSDIDTLMAVLNCLVAQGNTVVVIEHNLDVIRRADWVVDLGPGAGRNGGRILCQGTPEDLIATPDSKTGQALANGRARNRKATK
ncbi:ATP-binding cassette domain-containing protein [Nocardia crassostreae]|uniref:ATP-binding cassette domain-containing protein n=1 Tax=Nocardia crassostreae TaxID=53428 RepID=UPI00082C36F1|nr:excinuclease ABC subunit UvrA [Nocardia crassostreae]